MSKVVISITVLEDNKYEVQIEDDIAISTEMTTSPQKTILHALKLLQIKGKRGRKKGSTIAKNHSIDTFPIAG